MTGPALQAFTAGLAPEFSSLVTILDETIHSAAALDSAIKWRQLTYAVHADYHHWICAINVTNKQVTLRFHFGGLLSDPEGVFRVGESKWMRSLDFKPGEAVGKREYFKENCKRLQEE